jgi:hypothetical protein
MIILKGSRASIAFALDSSIRVGIGLASCVLHNIDISMETDAYQTNSGVGRLGGRLANAGGTQGAQSRVHTVHARTHPDPGLRSSTLNLWSPLAGHLSPVTRVPHHSNHGGRRGRLATGPRPRTNSDSKVE